MIAQIWEVFQKDSDRHIVFKTEKLALSQKFIIDVDFIINRHVALTPEEIKELNKNGYFWIEYRKEIRDEFNTFGDKNV